MKRKKFFLETILVVIAAVFIISSLAIIKNYQQENLNVYVKGGKNFVLLPPKTVVEQVNLKDLSEDVQINNLQQVQMGGLNILAIDIASESLYSDDFLKIEILYSIDPEKETAIFRENLYRIIDEYLIIAEDGYNNWYDKLAEEAMYEPKYYLIIWGQTPNPMPFPVLDFIKFKETRGYEVLNISLADIKNDPGYQLEEGGTQEDLRKYLRDLNQNRCIDYILFVGDSNCIPQFSISGIQTDAPYSTFSDGPEIEENDPAKDIGLALLGEIPVGRIPFTSPEILEIVFQSIVDSETKGPAELAEPVSEDIDKHENIVNLVEFRNPWNGYYSIMPITEETEEPLEPEHLPFQYTIEGDRFIPVAGNNGIEMLGEGIIPIIIGFEAAPGSIDYEAYEEKTSPIETLLPGSLIESLNEYVFKECLPIGEALLKAKFAEYFNNSESIEDASTFAVNIYGDPAMQIEKGY